MPSYILQPGRWRPEVRRSLEDLLLKRGRSGAGYDPANPPVAVFDWDETCIANDIGNLTFFYCIEKLAFRLDRDDFWRIFPDRYGRETVRRTWEDIRYLSPEEAAGHPSFPKYRKALIGAVWHCFRKEGEIISSVWMARMHVGLTPERVRELSSKTIEAEMNRPLGRERIASGPDDPEPLEVKRGIRIYEEMKDLVSRLEEHGFQVWVVTLTAGWIVQAFALRFGIPYKRVVGLNLREEKGLLTDEIIGPVTAKAGKVEAIDRFIGRPPLLVAGDSVNDLDMLACSRGLSLVIDRSRPEVLQAARQSGWLIQEAFIPVEIGSNRSYIPDKRSG